MIPSVLCAIICFIAAYTDHKTGYIDEWLTNMGIFAGVVLLFIFQPWNIAWLNIGIAILVFAIGFAFFITGQLGGGDVKLFTVISLLMPYSVQILPPILLIFTYSGFLCIIGVFVSLIPKICKIRHFYIWDVIFSIVFFIISCIMVILLSNVFDAIKLALFSLIFLISSVMLLYRTELKNQFVGYLPADKIQEEDVLVISLLPHDIVSKYKLNPLIMKKDIEILKSINEIKAFPVYIGLPRFGLYIFLAVLIQIFIPTALFG